MRTILITGGAGFVGRHFTKYFLDQGDRVICVDPVCQFTGGLDPEKWPLFSPLDYDHFEFHKQDCRIWFKENPYLKVDYAFHLAAMVGGREMIENNPLAVSDDLSIDAHFFQWAKEAMPFKSVIFSSSAAYPIGLQTHDNYQLLSEDMITFTDQIGMPDMTYGWAKLTSEYLAKLAFETHGIKSVVYRPFSGYGEDQDLHYPFPSICKRAIESRSQSVFNVWGTGDQMRDFIHISDCVRGVISTMDKIDNAEAINLSTGILTSFKQFAKKATTYCGYSADVVGLSNKPTGVFARGGDTTKQASLGFTPSVSFDEGIQRGIEYFQSR